MFVVICLLGLVVVGLVLDLFNIGVIVEDGVWFKGWIVFFVSCKVVYVVCVFLVEEMRVRLLMFFKFEVLIVEEGKE